LLLVILGLGSSYAETFETSEFFQKDGAFPNVTTMDISTDGISRSKVKKRGE
jgi:hypothetical protein